VRRCILSSLHRGPRSHLLGGLHVGWGTHRNGR
jgi:hypothetical protein